MLASGRVPSAPDAGEAAGGAKIDRESTEDGEREAAVPEVSVCIVSWNTREHLERCLSSLVHGAERTSVEVIVVDNASSDGSAELVQARFPEVVLLQNSENQGFARASNRALRWRRGRHAMLLNPDVVVCEGAIDHLLDGLEACAEVGAATGRLISQDGGLQHIYYRRDLGLWGWLMEVANGLTWNVARERMARSRNASFDESSSVDLSVLAGGCMMVRDRVLESVGLLDEDFFVWYEDVEWCRRIRSAGWRLVYCPAARFLHEGGASFRGWKVPEWTGQMLTSLLIFLDKHYPAPLMVLARGALSVNFLLYLAAVLVARLIGYPRGGSRFTLRDRLRWVRVVLLPPRRLIRRARWQASWPG